MQKQDRPKSRRHEAIATTAKLPRRLVGGVVIALVSVLMSTALAPAQTGGPLGVQVVSPMRQSVTQRVDGAATPVTIRGLVAVTDPAIDVRVVSRDQLAPFQTRWTRAATDASQFSIEFGLPPGWYDVQVRDATKPAEVNSHGPIGVGEVFVTAGQSNAANYGTERTEPGDGRVSALNIDTSLWIDAADPQPSASGNGGSPWPTFASELAVALDMPVGIVAVGIGGDRIAYWDPQAPLGFTNYDRIKEAIDQLGPNGMRAVLWHQGESDIRTDVIEYRDALERLIAQSRVDAGFAVSWGVAIASNGIDDADVVQAQEAVIARDRLVFRGPNTNDFRSLGYLGDSLHFNRAGLIEHGHRWFTTTIGYFGFVPAEPMRGDLDCSLGEVNKDDVLAALRAAIELPIAGPAGLPLRCDAADGTDQQRCDVDTDGRCTIRDVLLVTQCKWGKAAACAMIGAS